MTDAATVAAIWSSIQMDPELLEGLTFAQMDELVTYVAEHIDLLRQVPLGLLKRLMGTTTGDGLVNLDATIRTYRELLNLQAVRQHLDGLVGGLHE